MALTDGRRDTGIGTGKLSGWVRSKGFRILAISLAVIFILALAASMLYIYKDQERKFADLQQQKQQMQDKLDELSRENERLEGKLQFINSLEGLLQYARENLGYIDPSDTRYDDSDGN